MSTTEVRVVGVGLAFLLILVSGILLSRSGKPYNTALITVHKLVGLAAGVLLAMILAQAHRAAPLGPLEIATIAVTVLLFVGTVAAGAFLSIDKQMPPFVRRLHQVLPVLAALATAGTLYLLLSGR